MSESGNVPRTAQADAVKCTVIMNMAPICLKNSSQIGIFAISNRSGNSFVAMVLLFPKLRSVPDRVSRNRNRCG